MNLGPTGHTYTRIGESEPEPQDSSRRMIFQQLCTLLSHFPSTVRRENENRSRTPRAHRVFTTLPSAYVIPSSRHHSVHDSIRAAHCYLPWLDRRALNRPKGRRPKRKTDTSKRTHASLGGARASREVTSSSAGDEEHL